MTSLEGLSFVAIAVGSVAGMVIGALWYSPLLFSSAWLDALGKTEEDIKGGGAGPMVGSMVAALLSAIAIEMLVVATGSTSLLGGVQIGLLAGLGLVATALLSDSLFNGTGWKLYFIQTGYRVTYLVVMGAISGAWSRGV